MRKVFSTVYHVFFILLFSYFRRYLQKRYGVHTSTVILDFTNASAETYAIVADNLQGKEIGILINNAGLHYDYPMQFNEVFSSLNIANSFISRIIRITQSRFWLSGKH